MSDWGSRARIKELEDEVKRLKAQLRASGKQAFLAGYRSGASSSLNYSLEAWNEYSYRNLDKPAESW